MGSPISCPLGNLSNSSTLNTRSTPHPVNQKTTPISWVPSFFLHLDLYPRPDPRKIKTPPLPSTPLPSLTGPTTLNTSIGLPRVENKFPDSTVYHRRIPLSPQRGSRGERNPGSPHLPSRDQTVRRERKRGVCSG